MFQGFCPHVKSIRRNIFILKLKSSFQIMGKLRSLETQKIMRSYFQIFLFKIRQLPLFKKRCEGAEEERCEVREQDPMIELFFLLLFCLAIFEISSASSCFFFSLFFIVFSCSFYPFSLLTPHSSLLLIYFLLTFALIICILHALKSIIVNLPN